MKLLLQRYLAAQFIMPLLASTAFFISFMLTLELFKITEMLATRDISFLFVAGLLGNIALTFIPLSFPIAVFFSTIYALNRLSADSEYIAMRAGGMTKSRILLPFLIVAAVLSASVYQLNQKVIPRSNGEFRRKITYLTSSGVLAGIKEAQFFTLIPKVTLFATKSTKYGRQLEEVFLHLAEKDNQEKVIFSARGELNLERDDKNLTEKLTLTLFDGNIIGQDKKGGIEKILFSRYIFPISQNQFQDQAPIKETMLTSDELYKVTQMTKEEATKAYGFKEKDYFNSKYEYWNRKNGALICFIFCFLGFTLGISGNRGKSKSSGLIGLVCLIGYYALFFSMVSLAKKGAIPIPLAVFTPAAVLSLVGIRFYQKLDWQS